MARKTYGFSMKRLTGVTNVKRKIGKATGVPTTKQGRRNKARRVATGGGCVISVLVPILFLIGCIAIILSIL